MPSSKLFIVCGPHGSGKSKLLQLLKTSADKYNIVSQCRFMNATIHCQEKYCSYYESRGIPTQTIETNLEESPQRFLLDDLLWLEIPSQEIIKQVLDEEAKHLVLNVSGMSVKAIESLIQLAPEGRSRVVVVDCSNNEKKWHARLKDCVLWDDYEIEKLVQRGKWFVSEEIPKLIKHWEVVDNDSSLDEGLNRLVRALNRSRVHSEDVELFYNTRHKTMEYLKSLNIHDLLEHLMTTVLVEQPENPRRFLVDYLKSLKSDGKDTTVFHNDDLDAMFSMIDLTGQGTITKDQFRKGIRNLIGDRHSDKIDQLLQGADDKIDKETFLRLSNEALEVKLT